MTENMKAFLEQMNQNQALKNELEALGKEQLEKNKDAVAQKVVEIAAKHGFTLTAEDMETETAELTEEQLKMAAGGSGCCVCAVLGGGGEGFNREGYCICVVGGHGGYSDLGEENLCLCVLGGAGWDY